MEEEEEEKEEEVEEVEEEEEEEEGVVARQRTLEPRLGRPISTLGKVRAAGRSRTKQRGYK